MSRHNWQPLKIPPDPSETRKWSDKAETVWQELIRWKQRPPKRENVVSDSNAYYSNIYQHNFGTPLPDGGFYNLQEVSHQTEQELLTQITSTLKNIKKEDTTDDYCSQFSINNHAGNDHFTEEVPIHTGIQHGNSLHPRIMPSAVQKSDKTHSSCTYGSRDCVNQNYSDLKDAQKMLATATTAIDSNELLEESSGNLYSNPKSAGKNATQEENYGSQLLFSQLTEDLSGSQESHDKGHREALGTSVMHSPPLDLSPDNETFQILSQKYPSMCVQDGYNVTKSNPSLQGTNDQFHNTKEIHSSENNNSTSKSLFTADDIVKVGYTRETETKQETMMSVCGQETCRQTGNVENRKIPGQQTVDVIKDQELDDCSSKGKTAEMLQPRFTISGRLGVLNQLMKQNKGEPKKRKVAERPADSRKTFAAPFKKTQSTLQENKNKTAACHNTSITRKQYSLQDVASLSEADRMDLKSRLDLAEELALCLMYQDGSSQLREDGKHTERKKTNFSTVPKSLVVAYPDEKSSTSHKLSFVLFPLSTENKDLKDFCCYTIGCLMVSKARKLCFEAQELIKALITNMDFQEQKVCTEWRVFDVKVAGWLLNPDNPPITFKQVLMPCQDQQQEHLCDGEDEVCCDVALLGPAMSHAYHRLQQHDLWQLFTDIETPLIPILAVMETRSVLINTSEMSKTCDLLKKKISKLEQEAHSLAGQPFNVNSHPQLRQILFEVLHLDTHLPKSGRSKTKQLGNQSTSEAVLSQLSDVHPLPKVVLEHRQLQKLKSTYIDGMMAHVINNQLYTHWDQIAAATGRLTSTNPNIQAIPKLPIEVQAIETCIVGKKIPATEIFARAPFISREGWSFLAVDFRQIELRILAHLSKDETLLKIFNSKTNGDIFIELASLWHCKPLAEVTSLDREQAKRVVYAVMYGAGKDRLAQYLKISPEDARAIMQSFLLKFPGISSYTKSCISAAKAQRYQTTIFRRRRFLPKITDTKPQLQAQAERQAINFSVQGSAADLCKRGMVQVEQCLQSTPHLQGKLLFQIHDELLLEVPDDQIHETTRLVKGIMEESEHLCGGMCTLSIPLEVSLSVGKSWGHLKEYQPECKSN